MLDHNSSGHYRYATFLCCLPYSQYLSVCPPVALSQAAEEKEATLDELKRTLISQHEDEREKLSEKHQAEITQLNAQLTDKTAELDLATEEIKRLQTAIDRSEQGLGSATGEVEKLRSQVLKLQGELGAAQRQLEGSKKEINQLKV